jgi:hypothetical protein
MAEVPIHEGFADYVNMFLKLKQEPSGYPSWVQSEEQCPTNRGLTPRTGICFGQGINFQKCRAKDFGNSEIKIDVG